MSSILRRRVLPGSILWIAFLVGWTAPAAWASSSSTLSDAIKAKRPIGGEFFGLYLLEKKVGYIFSDLTFEPGSKDKIRSINEFVFKANVGGRSSERYHREIRVYEAKPNGRLVSFSVEQKGDGGDQILEGTATSTGFTVLRKRPGIPNQILHVPGVKERAEDADQARVAVMRTQTVVGTVLDADDLSQYKVTTTVGPVEERLIKGVRVKLRRASTISEKEHVPVDSYLTDNGDMVEIDFGESMKARAEPESVAKSLDQVEVFSLTRVVLPRALPADVRRVPNTVKLVVEGLPDRFQKSSPRQKFKKLGGGKVEVTLSAFPPLLPRRVIRPLPDPNGGENLKNSIIMETDNPEIVARARGIVGNEKDAYRATQKIVAWVAKNMAKDYGASSDRATDVLRQMKGDCTEHSLLTVALLRAVGIPAKRVDGLIYMLNESEPPALYWHEWVAAYVGEWIQVDPTFNQEVADATHFALGEESNAEITPLIGQMRVVDVL